MILYCACIELFFNFLINSNSLHVSSVKYVVMNVDLCAQLSKVNLAI